MSGLKEGGYTLQDNLDNPSLDKKIIFGGGGGRNGLFSFFFFFFSPQGKKGEMVEKGGTYIFKL